MANERPATHGPVDPDEPGVRAVEPEIPEHVEARVRAMLAALADPGPMPEEVSDRIEGVLAEEVRLRVEPGPLTAAEYDRSVLAPLIRQRQRPRPLFALAAVAAAAAVIAVGGSALHLSQRTNVAASLAPPTTTPTSMITPSAVPTTAPAPIPGIHIIQTRADYTASNLTAKAATLPTRPDAPWEVLAAQSPSIGPLATPTGVVACLEELGLEGANPVHLDLAEYDDAPAAIILATQDGTTTVHVVQRTCGPGHPGVIRPAVPLE